MLCFLILSTAVVFSIQWRLLIYLSSFTLIIFLLSFIFISILIFLHNISFFYFLFPFLSFILCFIHPSIHVFFHPLGFKNSVFSCLWGVFGLPYISQFPLIFILLSMFSILFLNDFSYFLFPIFLYWLLCIKSTQKIYLFSIKREDLYDYLIKFGVPKKLD